MHKTPSYLYRETTEKGTVVNVTGVFFIEESFENMLTVTLDYNYIYSCGTRFTRFKD